ncbi:MAG: SEC-C domain-containing protein [Planctomycetes bacterium]|nr:SEC-C domain-containing protein [Planctomycetota bacterium]
MSDLRVGRNDPCPCGSGKKFKKCCLLRLSNGPPPTNGFGPRPEPGTHSYPAHLPETAPTRMPPGKIEPGKERVIGTTAEHPFYVYGKGWRPLAEIQPGDWIRTDDGWVEVNKVEDTGRYETVYNLKVADYHTYFVGAQDWGFGVWAHNTCKDIVDPTTGKVLKTAAQVEAEIEAGLIAKGVNPALAKRITAEAAKPLADGNLLHELVQNGHVTPANAVDLLSAPKGGGSATFSTSQLQKKFKHAGDFGVTGPANKANLAAYEGALKAHLANPDVVAVSGTYLNKPATLHIHPDTNLTVIVDSAGAFQSGWKLSPQQQIYGLILGRLGGH